MEFFSLPLSYLTSKITLPIHGYVKNDMKLADGSQFVRYFTGKFENSPTRHCNVKRLEQFLVGEKSLLSGEINLHQLFSPHF